MNVQSGDAGIYYRVLGEGFPVVLLHPFPASHGFWLPAAQQLIDRYRLILPDLRAHGLSQIGGGAATMARHAGDLLQILTAESISRAAFVGVSISGYILLEFWRRHRDRVAALVLANTRATADTEEGKKKRLASIEDTRQHGPAGFLNTQVQLLMGESARRNRPDLVAKARELMEPMGAENIAAAQQGMAERPNSVPTLKTIQVPTLIIAGEEDTVTPVSDAELMRSHIAGSRMEVLRHAGHYAIFEQPEVAGRIIRRFLDSLTLSG